MEFILFIFIVMLGVSLSNTKFRLYQLERKVKSIEEQGVQVVTDMVLKNQDSAGKSQSQTVDASESSPTAESLDWAAQNLKNTEDTTLKDTFPSNKAPVHITDEELGGRWLGKIGIAAVLLGVAFFIKYAFDNDWIGPFGRVLVGLTIGTLGIVLGQMLRKTYEHYSDVLVGGGIGILYLSAYSGFFFYHLFEAPFAYLFLLLITFVSVALSLYNSSKTLAIVAIIGGLVTPLLVSMSSPSYIELLTYMLILDIGVILISYVYKWIELNHVAFVGTMCCFAVNALSHITSASADFKIVSITFYSYAFVYFLIFLAASIAHHIIRKELSTKDDVAFVFMNGVIHGLLGYLILEPVYPNLMGYFMLALAALYSVVAYISFVTHREDEVLNRFLAGMAAGFLTAAIPLHFDGSWIAIIWFVEAIVFYLVDKNLKGQNLYTYGAVVYALALIQVFMHNAVTSLEGKAIFANTNFGMYVLAIITAYILCGILASEENIADKHELKTLQSLYFGVANILTLLSITSEISRYYDIRASKNSYYSDGQNRIYSERNTVISMFWMLYAILMLVIGFVGKIRYLRLFGLGLFFLTAAKLFLDVFTLGPLYAIVSSIALGVLALMGSFGYAKYSEKLKQLM